MTRLIPDARARYREIARERFGYTELRPGQAEAIEALIDGHDTLAVMSTGSGKSAIYQIAALLLDGPTVVISPLIALQHDQVEALQDADEASADDLAGGSAAAAEINSNVSVRERREAFEDLEDGDLEFIFVTPEQLTNEEVVAQIRETGPSLFVVDEAHCISEWGHDFRPDYLKLGAMVDALGRPLVLALTATASPPVREEIVERLHMREPRTVVRGFDRANLRLTVQRFTEGRHKRRALLEQVHEAPKPGIVYAATRRMVDEIADELQADGVRAVSYHAGLAAKKRDAIQEDFMVDRVDVIVATTAFGMGIDKPNTRWVFHHDVADSVDSYYQEIGRAGRDGQPAEAKLFYRPEDLGLRRFFAGTGKVDQEALEQVVEAVEEGDEPVAPEAVVEGTDLSQAKVTTALTRLEEVGAVETLPTGDVIEAPDAPPVREAVAEALEAEQDRHAYDRSRVEMMRGYAEHRFCRREFVLAYFGEEYEAPCGNCDNCEAGHGVAPAGSEPFAVGSSVLHASWGEGLVQRYEGEQVVVLFESVGYKRLGVDIVVERGLLEPAPG